MRWVRGTRLGRRAVTAVEDLSQLGQRADAVAGVGLPENLVRPLTAFASRSASALPSLAAGFSPCGFAFAQFRCQVVARAFALIWSNSAWVIVPASRSCLADAI